MTAQYVPSLASRLVFVTLLAAISATSIAGQQPASAETPLPAYRPPALALVQPAAGGSVPQDRPVVVFRFTAGEPNDPIDIGSFIVTVDGLNRTALFQVISGEAWGPLSAVGSSGRPAIATGSHQVAARICSSRGACSHTSAAVVVVNSSAGPEGVVDRKRSVLDVLLDVARKLLTP